MVREPALILVTGAPATGKTTLAHQLSNLLRYPIIARDDYSAIICDALRPVDLDESDRFRPAAVALHYALIRQLLVAGVSVIAEGNFHRDLAEPELRPSIVRARAVQIHCEAEPDVRQRRFRERFDRGERHWSFFDEERLARVRSGQRKSDPTRYLPLDLDIPLLRVDTTDGYGPALDGIVRFISSMLLDVCA